MANGEKPQFLPERCPPVGSVLTRRITAREALPAVGQKATLEELQSYLSENISKELARVISAENAVGSLISPDAVAIHVSFSWG